jgi:thiamine-phosphate pyrophosphorylase
MMDLGSRMALFDQTGLYVVITEEFCGGRPGLSVLEAVLEAGVKVVQFREKGADGGDLYRRCVAFRERTRAAGALLIVDDRLDIAMAAGADGVHLGQNDLPVAAARALAPELMVGASSHNLAEALAAQEEGASYVNIGPIFPTATKSVSTGPVGPEMIDEIRTYLIIPFTCMGGIKESNIREVVARGARHVAVVTAVTQAENVRLAAERLERAIAQS